MAKVNIIRWDDVNYLPKLLDDTDTALINSIDTTGSTTTLTLGSGSATQVVLGSLSTAIIVSGSALLLSYATASVGMKITGTVDLAGQTSFALDGQYVSTNQFTAANLSRLFNGSNVDDLHTHTITLLTGSTLLNPDILQQFPVAVGLTGTQVVYLNGNAVVAADANTATDSRIIGIVSGTLSRTYDSGTLAPIHTVYGDLFNGFTNLTGGAVYYLSSTAGSISTVPPNSAGRTIVQVGIAASPTTFIFQPNIVVRGLG